MWTPDPKFEQHVGRLVTRAIEEARINEDREQKVADGQLAARGVLNSGMTIKGRRERAAAAFQSAGQRLITETVDALTDILQPLPPQAIDWLRTYLKKRFEGYANGRAQALAMDPLVRQLRIQGNHDRELQRVRATLDRDLEIALTPLELKSRLGAIARGDLPSKAPGPREIDAFISHASEDKAAVAKPIADGLIGLGFKVWLDHYELKVGDNLYEKIDDGLRQCRFGVLVVSPHFFAKNWPRRELAALAALSDAEGKNKLLPVWHGVTQADVAAASPLLAPLYATNTEAGIAAVVEQIGQALKAL